MTNENGEKVSISQKCTELDKHIPELIGVSSSAMDSVIFCHQEDSNWPLQDSAALKKRFDELFESARYTKALDAVRLLKKDIASKAKDLKVLVAELGAHFQSATDLRTRLEACIGKKDCCQRELDEVLDKKDLVDSKMLLCAEVMRKFQGVQHELHELERRVQESERRIQDRRLTLEQEIQGTDAELVASLRDFDKSMEHRRSEQMGLQRSVDGLNEEIASLRTKNGTLHLNRGEALALQQQVQSQHEALQKLLRDSASSIGLKMPSSSATADTNVRKDFLRLMDKKLRETQAEMDGALGALREAVAEKDRLVMEAEVSQQRCKIELTSKESECRKVMDEKESLRVEQSNLGIRRANAKAERDDKERELDLAKADHEAVASTYLERSSAYRNQLKDTADRIRGLTDVLSADDQVLQDLSSTRAESERLLMQERQAETDEAHCCDEVRTLWDRHRESAGRDAVVGDVAELPQYLDKLKRRAEDVKRDLDRQSNLWKNAGNELSRLEAAVQQGESRVAELSDKSAALELNRANLNACMEEFGEKVRGPWQCEHWLEEHPWSDRPSLDEIQKQVTALSEYMFEDYLAYKSAVHWQRKLKRKSVKQNNKCPCCERDMDAGQVQLFEGNLLSLFKANATQEEEAKVVTESIREFIGRLTPILTQLRASEGLETELAALKAKVRDDRGRLLALRDEEREREAVVLACQKSLEALNKFSFELSTIRTRWEDAAAKRRDSSSRRTRQSQSVALIDTGGRTFAEIETALRTRREEMEAMQKKKDTLVNDSGRLEKAYYSSKNRLAEAEKDLSDLQTKEQRQIQIQKRMADLEAQDNKTQDEKLKIGQRVTQAERELQQRRSTAVAAKADLTLREAEAADTKLVALTEQDRAKRLVDSVNEMERRVAAAAATGKDLASIDKDIDFLKRDIQAKENKVREIGPQIAAMQAGMLSLDERRRHVQQNLSLREAIAELHEQQARIAEISDQVGGGAKQYQESQRENSRAEKEKNRLVTEEATLKGRMEELVEQVASLEKSLRSEVYRDIDGRHRRKNIEYETTMLAVADLDSYFTALDHALMNFHNIKIREVNKVVKELWQAIYRGEDIETIELISGEEGESTGGAKRSYNYRVVMRKGDAQLEMRGRCSAGQCVLAGIVIRLALADTFSISCGILALDEPTTNLDEPNKAGLAQALAALISARSRQQNFQLVCITHDEEFVQLIRSELSAVTGFSLPEYYFRVSREDVAGNGKYFSHIERIPWEDM